MWKKILPRLALILVLGLAIVWLLGPASAPETLAGDEPPETVSEESTEEETLEEFVPSEEVPADAELSFPVDI